MLNFMATVYYLQQFYLVLYNTFKYIQTLLVWQTIKTDNEYSEFFETKLNIVTVPVGWETIIY